MNDAMAVASNNNKRERDEIGCVFLHGAGLNGGIWEPVLNGLGAPYLLGDYKAGRSGKSAGLRDYAEAVAEQIRAWPVERFVIVAHSLGGVLGLRIAAELPERVAGFAAIGAVIPKDGGSFLSAQPFPRRLLMNALLRGFGAKPPESAIRSGLCHDLSQEQAETIVGGFVAEGLGVYTERSGARIPDVPRLYVKLSRDRELSPSDQDRMIAHFAPHHTVQVDAGHLPMLSKPDELRAALQSFRKRL